MAMGKRKSMEKRSCRDGSLTFGRMDGRMVQEEKKIGKRMMKKGMMRRRRILESLNRQIPQIRRNRSRCIFRYQTIDKKIQQMR